MQAVWKHQGAMLSRDPRQRRIGRRALPYMILFQIVLPIVAPLIDLFALYGHPVQRPGAGARVLARRSTSLQLVHRGRSPSGSTASRCGPLWALPLQQFVYRQLMYLVIIESTVSAVQGLRSGWQHLPRTGEVEVGGRT